MLFKLLILVIKSKKVIITQQLKKLKKVTDLDHSNKYITTEEFNKLMSQNFAARLAQANLASKNGIAALVKTTEFDDKLKDLNKKVTSNKTKRIEAKQTTDLTNKVTQIPEKGNDFLLGRMNFTGNDGYQILIIVHQLHIDNLKKTFQY